MKHASQLSNPNWKSYFRKDWLPSALEYFQRYQMKLTGIGKWRSTICPFHADTKPSLSICIENGAFKCWSCGAKGGDIVAFHQKRFGLSFKDACIDLGAWEQS